MSGLLCFGKRSKNKVPTEKKPTDKDPGLKSKKKKSGSLNRDNVSLLNEKDNDDDITGETVSLQHSVGNTCDELKLKLTEIESKCSKLEKENEDLGLSNVKIEELSRCLANAEQEIERLRNDNVAMVDESKTKAISLAKSDTLIVEKNNEVEELKEIIAAKYGTSFENQETQTEEDNELYTELQLTKRQLNEIVDKLYQVEAINSKLINENSSIAEMQTIAHQVEQEVKQLIEENVRLELHKIQITEKLVEYERQMTDVHEENELLKEQIKNPESWVTTTEIEPETEKLYNIDDRLSEAERNQEELSQLIDEINVTVKSLELRQATIEKPRLLEGNYHLHEIPNRLSNTENQHMQLNDFLEQIAEKCAILEKRLKADEEKDPLSIFKIAMMHLEEVENDHRQFQIDYIQLNESMASMEVRLAVAENQNKELLTTNELSSMNCARLEKEVHELRYTNQTTASQYKDKQIELCRTKEEYSKVLEENEKILEHARELEMREIKATERCRELEAEVALVQNEDISESSSVSGTGAIASNYPIAAVTDQSDKPLQIAEKFRKDLYGRLWSEAAKTLAGNGMKDTRKIVQVLLELSIEAYMFCKRISRHQLECLINLLCSPCNFRNGPQQRSKNAPTRISHGSLPNTLRKQLQNFREAPSEELVELLSQEFFNHVEYERSRHLRSLSGREMNDIMGYIRMCLELSWQMVAHDPPMYLQFKARHCAAFEEDKFDTYSTSGKKVDYLVWPAVLREDNGAILQKGVIQCITDRP